MRIRRHPYQLWSERPGVELGYPHRMRIRRHPHQLWSERPHVDHVTHTARALPARPEPTPMRRVGLSDGTSRSLAKAPALLGLALIACCSIPLQPSSSESFSIGDSRQLRRRRSVLAVHLDALMSSEGGIMTRQCFTRHLGQLASSALAVPMIKGSCYSAKVASCMSGSWTTDDSVLFKLLCLTARSARTRESMQTPRGISISQYTVVRTRSPPLRSSDTRDHFLSDAKPPRCTPPVHPTKTQQQRTDGQVERINAILAAYLRGYVRGFKNDWAAYLALAEFAYNRHYQASIQMTPFFADLGYNPPMLPHNEIPKQPDANDVSSTFPLHMERILRDLQAKVRETAQKMNLQYDKGAVIKFVNWGHLIEDILDHRLDKDGLDEYKCKWVGAIDDIAWEPVTNLKSVPRLIKQYLRRLNLLNPRGSKRIRECEAQVSLNQIKTGEIQQPSELTLCVTLSNISPTWIQD
ncbi:unnamed protein product [Phytophthora lilii]|uniref:Unnamed protein product n=1 Tax=Phytophthora lilii TaxID=2077276 RepID=A0A9W6TVX0_9STRA|nr:unnamed protein product [Phytophthora lilii]